MTYEERILKAIEDGAANQVEVLEFAHIGFPALAKTAASSKKVREALDNLPNMRSKGRQLQNKRRAKEVDALLKKEGITCAEACKRVGVSYSTYKRRRNG
ncbi:hypothetical protein vBAmePPT11V19_00059 [Alteromonas phage vB_AmeP_PT11-V19]|nr:hypothetical protein vBAmePPT11V19_00059 [Alteromonas phage vB_AmeP_PT11-V19]